MKIAIFTHPLRVNYGGLLQAYALQVALHDMGHDAVTDNQPREYSFIETNFFHKVKRVMKKYIFCRKGVIISPVDFERRTERTLKDFVNESCKTMNFDKIGRVDNFDAFIVGSDQVWRPTYIRNLNKYFLGFTGDANVKRLSYAASFGRDDISEFSAEQLSEYAPLLQKFDAVSVREDSGVGLCKNYFGADATHVLDPTMLLDVEDYLKLIDADEPNMENIITCYILDKSIEKDNIVNIIEQQLGSRRHDIIVKSKNPDDGITNCTMPSVSTWIAGFRDAKFVVTDSFHGTVFAIIFNKPFIAIANKDRGLSRFTSLLRLFDLEDRLVLSAKEMKDIHFDSIKWENINNKREKMKKISLDFLRYNLRNE